MSSRMRRRTEFPPCSISRSSLLPPFTEFSKTRVIKSLLAGDEDRMGRFPERLTTLIFIFLLQGGKLVEPPKMTKRDRRDLWKGTIPRVRHIQRLVLTNRHQSRGPISCDGWTVSCLYCRKRLLFRFDEVSKNQGRIKKCPR